MFYPKKVFFKCSVLSFLAQLHITCSG